MKYEQNLSVDIGSDSDDEGIPVSTLYKFSLLEEENRQAFLFAYYWIGETALFAAVSHVWDRLAEPRGLRCTQMGQLSGVGGEGKQALLLTLQQFLAEALAVNTPLPSRTDYSSLAEWHVAAMGTFAADKTEIDRLCQVYSSILNGSPANAPELTKG